MATYSPFHTDWKDFPDTTTPISAAALEHIEAGIGAAARDSVAGTLCGFHQDLHYSSSGSDQLQTINVGLAMGMKVSRSTLIWSKANTSAGVYNWTDADTMVNQLVAAGITPILWIGSFPTWLSGYTSQWELMASAPNRAAAAAAYVTFVQAAVARYSDRVRHWEIWNEQNETNFLSYSTNNQASRETVLDWYGNSLYLPAKAAILAIDPGAVVAVGGITGLGASGVYPNSGNLWLTALIADIGIENIDAVAIHPYTSSAAQAADDHVAFSQNFDDIQLIRNTLDGIGGPDVEIWLTEFGWTSASPSSQAIQATNIRRAMEIIRDYYGYVKFACVFVDRDLPGYPAGLYLSDRVTPKLAAAEFTAVAAQIHARGRRTPLSFEDVAGVKHSWHGVKVSGATLGDDPEVLGMGLITIPTASAWTSYTPTISQPGSIAKTVTYAKYIQVGGLVQVVVNLAPTASGTTSNAITVSLPVTAADANGIMGNFRYHDASVGYYFGSAEGASTTSVQFLIQHETLGTSFAIANGDRLKAVITYAAA